MKPGRISAFTAIFIITAFSAPSIKSESSEIVYAFRNYKSSSEKMILVGEITSKIKLPISPGSSPYKGYDSRMDQVTVKVKDRRGIKIGQKLFVVDKNPHHSQYRNALITGEIIVKSLFHSPFYGWVLTGTGILLRVREGNFVVRTLESENLEFAFALKKKGDHYVSRGEIEKAIANYNRAVEADRSLPEAHAALGKIYFDIKENRRAYPVQALAEYQEAFRHMDKFRYDYDRFTFCSQYMEVLDHAYRIKFAEGRGENNQILLLLDRSIELGNAASEINGNHPEILMRLFRAHTNKIFYYEKRSSSVERESYDSSQNLAAESFFPLLQGPIASAETHRIAVHYLLTLKKEVGTPEASRISGIVGRLYASPVYALNRSSQQISSSQDLDQRLFEMISYHMSLYFRYGGGLADPVLEKLKGTYLL